MRAKRLTTALTALLVAQVLHGLAPPPEDAPDTGSIVGFIGGIGFLLAAGVALWWVIRGDDRGQRLARLIGVAIPVGFLLYHGAWFDSPVTNPYWGDGTANAAQWASLVPVVGTSIWAALLANSSRRSRAAA